MSLAYANGILQKGIGRSEIMPEEVMTMMRGSTSRSVAFSKQNQRGEKEPAITLLGKERKREEWDKREVDRACQLLPVL